MIGVLCEVHPGLRESERSVGIPDYHGKREYLRIEADYLRHVGENTYFPVHVVYEHEPSGSYLVQLPFEADSGTSRLFVRKENTIPIEVPR